MFRVTVYKQFCFNTPKLKQSTNNSGTTMRSILLIIGHYCMSCFSIRLTAIIKQRLLLFLLIYLLYLINILLLILGFHSGSLAKLILLFHIFPHPLSLLTWIGNRLLLQIPFKTKPIQIQEFIHPTHSAPKDETLGKPSLLRYRIVLS
jgi:hypothetical protein